MQAWLLRAGVRGYRVEHDCSVARSDQVTRLAAPLPIIWLLVSSNFTGCGSDTVCPGHLDPSRGQGLTIQTSDGSPTIASINFRIGASGCSSLSIEKPDASANGGYSQVTVYMQSDAFPDSAVPVGAEPDPCVVDVVSVDGRSVTVTATVEYHHKVHQHCVENNNCCPKAELEWVGSREFSPSVQTVSFSGGLDASVEGPDLGLSIDLSASTDGVEDRPASL